MSNLQRLAQAIATLQVAEACAIERQQTLSSIRPDLRPEVDEQPGALRHERERLARALGDVLCAAERLCQIGAKDMRFDAPAAAARDLTARVEPRRASHLDSIPRTLPALLTAYRAGEAASMIGFDWTDVHAVLAKVREELGELEEAIESGAGIVEEYGDLLQSCVHVGRHLSVQPESALLAANQRFSERFRAMEALAAAEDIELASASAATLDELWERIKAGA